MEVAPLLILGREPRVGSAVLAIAGEKLREKADEGTPTAKYG